MNAVGSAAIRADLTDSDIDIEEELEREREDTPLSEVEDEEREARELPREPDGGDPRPLAENKFSQIKNFRKATRVLTAAEQTLQSQILLLCSALGGADPSSENKRDYVLGVDALACLKDLKRWLKTVDDATNTWHVAAACHENALVESDLIPIVIQTPSRINDANKSYLQNVMLSTLELLVALTRPLVLDVEAVSQTRIDLYIRLKKAHVSCKERILNYEHGRCLKAVVGIALPILQLPKNSRTNRDTVILNLCMHFFRNVIRIEPADFTISKKKSSSRTQQVVDNIPPGIAKEDISFDNLIQKFKKNKVLMFVQTITAGLGTEFDSEILSPVCLEMYFYLTYGIQPSSLFEKGQMPERKAAATLSPALTVQNSKTGVQLADLMHREKEIKRKLFSNNMTRHANFGTLLSIKEGSDEDAITVGTQRGFLHSDPLEELDSGVSKRLAATRFTNRNKESTRSDFDTTFEASERRFSSDKTAVVLKQFCSDFTEAGFGVLTTRIRRMATSSSMQLTGFAEFHYLYIIAWILKFEALLREESKDKLIFKRFGYIIVCLEEQMIRMLMVGSLPRYLQSREYNLLRVSTDCFKEILLTAVEIHRLDNNPGLKLSDEDKNELDGYISISEAVLRNIFADEEIIDVLFRIPQDAQKVSLNYALDMTEFTQVLFNVLHYLSDLKIPIVLAKKVRQRSKKLYGENHDLIESGSDDDDGEFDVTNLVKLKRFQVLDRQRYSAFEERLFHEKIVDTHVWVFSRFAELDELQVRRCVSYFSRLLLKWKEHFLKLARLDFMSTLHDIKDFRYSAKTAKGISRLLSYFMRVLQKLQKHSKLILLEALTIHQEHDIDVRSYLLGGDIHAVREKQTKARAPDLIFADDNMSYSFRISVLVSLLLYGDRSDIVEDLAKIMKDFRDQRISWDNRATVEDGNSIPGSPTRSSDRLELPERFMHEDKRDARFRLLLKTIGFVRNVLPAIVTNEQINQTVSLVEVALSNPMESFELEGKVVSAEKPELEEIHKAVVESTGGTEETHEYSDLADDAGEDSEPIAGSGYVEENFDLMEARLEATEKRIKGRALKKRKRRRKEVDSEDDDVLPVTRNGENKKKGKRNGKHLPMHEGVEKIQKDQSETVTKHLSSKYVHSDDDVSDAEEEKTFFAREQRLLELVHENENKPLTPEQFNAVFHPDLGKLVVESDDEDLMIGNRITPSRIGTQVEESDTESSVMSEAAGQDLEDRPAISMLAKRGRTILDSDEE
ncbi:DEKNAAC105010 [Brettanomyces naardenensis]|uniref:Topoisomerase 1-associated factor 1 n=1 Tax=Brettanomyces naardenensis TaxID=13370 RepID=A0A448YRX1_BRENA|nr:DEKNAAC105010 [Brettanomyces naardenensis]